MVSPHLSGPFQEGVKTRQVWHQGAFPDARN